MQQLIATTLKSEDPDLIDVFTFTVFQTLKKKKNLLCLNLFVKQGSVDNSYSCKYMFQVGVLYQNFGIEVTPNKNYCYLYRGLDYNT